jgi:hypothetical protein
MGIEYSIVWGYHNGCNMWMSLHHNFECCMKVHVCVAKYDVLKGE